MMTLIEGHEGAMNLISRYSIAFAQFAFHITPFTVDFSIDGDIAAEIEHLTTTMDGSQDTVVAGLANSAVFMSLLRA